MIRNRRVVSSLFWILCGVFFLGEAQAQIVNVLPFARNGEEGVSGMINGALDWRSGNVDSTRVAADGMLSLSQGDHLTLLMAKGEMGMKSDALYLAKAFEHLRYRYRLMGPLSLETFAQHGYDKFQRLTYRVLAGLGMRYDVVSWESGMLSIGTAYMPEMEKLSEGISDEPSSFYHRWSNYLSFVAAIGDVATFSTTAYVQPRLDVFSDYRLSSETNFQLTIGKILVSPFAFSLAYDSAPPPSVEKLDMSIRSTLGLRF